MFEEYRSDMSSAPSFVQNRCSVLFIKLIDNKWIEFIDRTIS